MASGSQLKVKTIKYIIIIVIAGCFIINISYHLNSENQKFHMNKMLRNFNFT